MVGMKYHQPWRLYHWHPQNDHSNLDAWTSALSQMAVLWDVFVATHFAIFVPGLTLPMSQNENITPEGLPLV